jgi:uncharacterized protein (DUF1330 family)
VLSDTDSGEADDEAHRRGYAGAARRVCPRRRAIEELHAQTGNKPAYFVAEVHVTKPKEFQVYAAKASQTVKAAGGHFLVLLGKVDSKEGGPVRGGIVIAAFPSMAALEKWYSTPPYKELIPLRRKAARTRLYFIEGLPQ